MSSWLPHSPSPPFPEPVTGSGCSDTNGVPSGDYSSTTIFDVTDPTAPEDVLQTDGWSLRLFAVQ